MVRAQILIVGGGVAGLSTAYFLARAGARGVVLLEGEELLGAHSSAKNAAILRTLSSDPVTAALLQEGARFLATPPPDFSPLPLLDEVGLLVLTDEERARRLEQIAARAGAAAAPTQLDPSSLARLAPHVVPELGQRALFLEREGRIDIAALMDGWARGARAGGVSIRTGAHVEELLRSGGAVEGALLAGGERVEAELTAVAAGGWAERLGARAGSRLRLQATRRHLLTTAVDPLVDPRWPVVWDDQLGLYLRPESGGMLLCACDQSDVDPDLACVDPAVRERVAEKCARRLPSFAAAPIARLWCGLRTFSSDQRFAIGPDPDVPGLAWVAALGGHGMGSSPAVGRIAAARLSGRSAANPLEEALDPLRLAGLPTSAP